MEPRHLAALALALELHEAPTVHASPEEVSVLFGPLAIHVSATTRRGGRWTWGWRHLAYPRWGEA